jgi:serine/threonine protein kinase
MLTGPGARLDAYELIRLLGAGGMGEVWLAHDVSLGRKVAVKLLPQGLTEDPHRVARFEQEARAVSGAPSPDSAIRTSATSMRWAARMRVSATLPWSWWMARHYATG